ncbi:putative translation elongation factor EFTs/EF1B, UBA-like superfamily, nucleic acid-binding protein [Helianthus annuus]|uniref:Elongation factor Ts, mitochondrial n=1 Tax=Helianthus annuus TaxID=4232 RepID=A0A251TQ86_HELAN|nr:polyprotein of EF-Ts, chloroplastic isoform X1 [Helianthus annuus]XP_035834750.1 polyprotein of EF-Ts, chloroplastic isoform X1 [Helianthus annuus]KAF5788497.1 putative translation elongation factor EFTs/EF1B, UBA-like superfamily, nucleic acid-binding protein [Helianthus annuus]
MTPVIPSPTSSISLIPGCTFDTIKTKNGSIKCCNIKRSSRRTVRSLHGQSSLLPLSTSLRLFPHIRTFGSYHKPRFVAPSATGVDVDVTTEQADQSAPVSDQDSSQTSESTSTVDKSKQRSRPARKSEMPPVKNEELVVGATFTGKVRSIQPFGAFVDFGAFTDGLVHVSRLSDSYVKDVASVVSVGQEVKVKLVEANIETGRIALTMRESEPASGGETSRPPRKMGQKSNQRRDRDEGRKSTKFVKGQELEGTVKNLTRSGAFINLPEGEEGFLPASEEADEGFGSIMGDGSSLEIGQEVKVRVLRIARGQVTLTMKGDTDNKELDSKLQGKVYTATNPFLVAFRNNKDIASFLDDRAKVEEKNVEIASETDTQPSVEETEVVEPEEEKVEAVSNEEVKDETVAPETEDDEKVEAVSDEKVEDEIVSPETEDNEEVKAVSDEVKDEIVAPETEDNEEVKAVSDEVNDEEVKAVSDEVKDEEVKAVSDEKVEDEIVSSEPVSEEISSEASGADEDVKAEPVPEEITSEEKVEIPEEETTNASEEIPPLESVTADVAEPISDENGSVISEEEKVEAAAPAEATTEVEDEKVEVPVPVEATTKATISPALVKQLREETGAGMMDCKKALAETEGDLVKAQEYLRKKGLASADKKASRATAEGRIGSYIHDSRIGVLVEVNCETDFVSRGDIFKELVNDLAMQVAACPQVQYLVPEDVPKETIEKEKAIEMQKEDLLSKPEQFRSKIVDGRIKKRLDELALLEQAYIKNDKVVVKDFIKSTIATIGENIKVKRFVRFNLGEGLEKKTQDFAAEVAAQTTAKKASAPTAEPQPAATEEVKTVDEAPKATISAALVKQLREETGAGMMDCKKALSETGGDIEKAQEYLRKKGLSTADKKSARLAAEGRIGSYIHDSRIGVLIEVNCETDFVGRSEKFKELVDDLAMQVVACPKVEYVSIEDIPESIVNKEKDIEMQREDILSKPENIRGKIVEGRVSKRLGELALLEQPFLKDDSVLVKDFVKQTVAAIGENIKVRRFVRFTLGESTSEEPETETATES